jgi:hypothetical protein
MKRFLTLVLALPVLIAAACSSQPAAAPTKPPPVGVVYLGAADGAMAVIDAASSRVARTLPAGTPSPDWTRIYAAGGGALTVTDALTGAALASHPAPSWAGTVRTSPDGRWLALASTAPGTRSRFQVQDAAFARPAVRVDLPGSFTFDGVSNDGRRLYLLEWIAPGRYHVRMYDLAAGRLSPDVIAEKGAPPGSAMSGEAVNSLATADGLEQLTLYQRNAEGHAFVHVLPIGPDGAFGQHQPIAFCVDLPGPAEGWLMVPGITGSWFYAVNPTAGLVVGLAASGGQPPDVVQGRFPPAGGAPTDAAAAVSADGKTLYIGGATGLLALSTASFSVKARALQDRTITGLAVAPDGSSIYAVSALSRLLRIDAQALKPVADVAMVAPFTTVVRVA